MCLMGTLQKKTLTGKSEGLVCSDDTELNA